MEKNKLKKVAMLYIPDPCKINVIGECILYLSNIRTFDIDNLRLIIYARTQGRDKRRQVS